MVRSVCSNVYVCMCLFLMVVVIVSSFTSESVKKSLDTAPFKKRLGTGAATAMGRPGKTEQVREVVEPSQA